MSGKLGRNFWELEIYRRYEAISDFLWDIVSGWSFRNQRLIGDQLLRAVDSIGANIAESNGRRHYKDAKNFLFYARGSMAETQHWIRRASRNGLLKNGQLEYLRSETTILCKQLNAFISAQTPLDISKNGKVTSFMAQEEAAPYSSRKSKDNIRMRRHEPRARSH